jgi:DNA adenine methylase
MMKPFLKWVGGKTQIIEKVLELFPEKMTNYYEPFLGGGSVLLGVLSLRKSEKIQISGKVYASDLNSNLIGLYKNIQSKLDKVIEELKTIIEANPKTGNIINRKPQNITEAQTSQESYYYWIRSRFNSLNKEERQTPLGSAMFLFMNKTCFRGVYREGPKGFNVPYGNYKKVSFDEKYLEEISELIKDVEFSIQSFSNVLDRIVENDFVYLDPPYAPLNSKSFVAYTSSGFPKEMHDILFGKCNNLKSKFVLSNSDVPLVKNAFSSEKYKKIVILCKRSISSNPSSKINELLITN